MRIERRSTLIEKIADLARRRGESFPLADGGQRERCFLSVEDVMDGREIWENDELYGEGDAFLPWLRVACTLLGVHLYEE
jgi:hypothetical protein